MADSTLPDVEGKSHSASQRGQGELSSYSILELISLCRRRRRFLLGTIVGLLLLCLTYCVIASNQYEASARVALRMQPTSSLTVDTAETIAPASILSTPLQLETLANVLRSERLTWRVICGLKLYESAAFSRDFKQRFPEFDPEKPTPEAQGYLLETFGKRLHVRSLPRTLLLEIRFRSKDPALAAKVVNALIGEFRAQEGESRVDATQEASKWLQGQLKTLTAQVEAKERQLAEFERRNGFMTTEETVPGGQPVESLRASAVREVDEAERMWAAANGDRILHEALYMQAQQGDPEQILAANPELQAEMGAGGAALAQQLHGKLSDVNVELAQLEAEHGPKFPRVVELRRAQQEVQGQIQAEDENLVKAFEQSWKTAEAREQLLRKELDAQTEAGLRQNDATIEYSVLHDEVLSGRELCTRLARRMEEAELSAGVRGSSITVVDYARVPFKPVTPDPVLYLAITLFSGVWVALGGALLLDALRPSAGQVTSQVKGVVVCLIFLMAGVAAAYGQAPIPNTQGLPSGVVKLPEDQPAGLRPNAKEAPPVWNSTAPATGVAEVLDRPAGTAMALPIAVGDFLDVSEFHMPEFRSAVRVASDGTVLLPLVGQVKLAGMMERQASEAIDKALVDGGMLLHPQASVLVTNAAGQDVSVMGEVARPGVYSYTAHHRLLDLIAAASGLSANAGRLVSVFHREDAHTGHPVILDGGGIDAKGDHNPELAPGDTVMVSRAGLVYVIGDVVRPGGFAVDPAQGLTVVQALSLAWGASANAAASKAILIRDQTGGRTLTTLNLRRMIRGQDPDQPVRDRDILFVPDSTARDLMNKGLESAIQSAIGVSIYAGLVYSQRF